MERSYAHKGYAATYHVEIMSSSDSELQLKDTESSIINRLKD